MMTNLSSFHIQFSFHSGDIFIGEESHTLYVRNGMGSGNSLITPFVWINTALSCNQRSHDNCSVDDQEKWVIVVAASSTRYLVPFCLSVILFSSCTIWFWISWTIKLPKTVWLSRSHRECRVNTWSGDVQGWVRSKVTGDQHSSGGNQSKTWNFHKPLRSFQNAHRDHSIPQKMDAYLSSKPWWFSVPDSPQSSRRTRWVVQPW